MKQSRLHFTISAPRAGKSTYCTQWVRFFGESVDCGDPGYCPRTIVCADEIRLAMHKQRYNRAAEPMVFAVKNFMIKALIGRGMNVIVDGTHTTETSIRRLLEIDLDAVPHLIETPKDVCLERAVQTDQRDLIPHIERTHDQLTRLKARGIEEVMQSIREDILAYAD